MFKTWLLSSSRSWARSFSLSVPVRVVVVVVVVVLLAGAVAPPLPPSPFKKHFYVKRASPYARSPPYSLAP